MNRFRKLGFINYGEGGLQVHSSLLKLLREEFRQVAKLRRFRAHYDLASNTILQH